MPSHLAGNTGHLTGESPLRCVVSRAEHDRGVDGMSHGPGRCVCTNASGRYSQLASRRYGDDRPPANTKFALAGDYAHTAHLPGRGDP